MSWREFELLAEQIYRELEPNAQVTHNDHILGFESETLRQIDVSIKYTIDGDKQLIIIQAKDYDKPADINVVGEFSAVVRDVRANQGILICKGGFTRNAYTYAKNLGIDICNIHDAQSRRWVLDIKFPIIWTDVLPIVSIQITVNAIAGDFIQKDAKDVQLLAFNEQGEYQGNIPLMNIFIEPWNAGKLPRIIDNQFSMDCNVSTLQIMVANENENKFTWREIESLKLAYTVRKKSWLGSFSPEECRGILNYSDGTFQPSYLRIGEIPFEKGIGWQEIDDPDQLAVTIKGLVVTTEHWELNINDLNLRIADNP